MSTVAAMGEQTTCRPASASRTDPPARTGVVALNAVNFFLAEVVGVAVPFVSDLLRDREWSRTEVGAAVAAAGLGTFLAQTPAGMLLDRVRRPRELLAVSSVVVGTAFAILPLVPAAAAIVYTSMFVAGVMQAVFAPALCALALGVGGPAGFARLMGANQGWNHAGNLAAALGAMAAAALFGAYGVFAGIWLMSVLAAGSAMFVPADGPGVCPSDGQAERGAFKALFQDRRVIVLVAAVALFHLANAPVMPLVAVQVNDLGGTATAIAAVVLVAQAVMIPVAYLAGLLSERWGRKWVFAAGFLALPVRIALYAFADTPGQLIAIQALDGIGAGIYGVVIAAVAADLTRGKAGFNTLNGVLATALAVGGVVGPLVAGWAADRFGYRGAYGLFAAVAAAGAVVFVVAMPETKPADAEGA